MRKCSKCLIEKDDSNFSKIKNALRGRCKSCIKIISAEYYLKNKDTINGKNKRYWRSNKEKLNDWQRQYHAEHKKEKREYVAKNKDILSEKRRVRENFRLQTDIAFRLRKNIAYKIRKFIKGNGSSKNGSCADYLEYSFQELKEHLEQQFEPWMNWENWGKYNPKSWNDNDPTTWTWQLDHIIPHSKFSYKSMDEDRFKMCWSLKNLRPLSAKQNILDGCTKIRHKITNYEA